MDFVNALQELGVNGAKITRNIWRSQSEEFGASVPFLYLGDNDKVMITDDISCEKYNFNLSDALSNDWSVLSEYSPLKTKPLFGFLPIEHRTQDAFMITYVLQGNCRNEVVRKWNSIVDIIESEEERNHGGDF